MAMGAQPWGIPFISSTYPCDNRGGKGVSSQTWIWNKISGQGSDRPSFGLGHSLGPVTVARGCDWPSLRRAPVQRGDELCPPQKRQGDQSQGHVKSHLGPCSRDQHHPLIEIMLGLKPSLSVAKHQAVSNNTSIQPAEPQSLPHPWEEALPSLPTTMCPTWKSQSLEETAQPWSRVPLIPYWGTLHRFSAGVSAF